MDLTFEAVDEDRPGSTWRERFDRHWHAYSRWFVRDGIRARPTYLASIRALRSHMPELLPTYEALVDAAGGGDLEARFLAMWCPPVYIGGCSQLLLGGDQPVLIRNYDYSPRLLEGTWLASRYGARRTIAMVDCLWGVLDGVNEDGLAVSLSFGGRNEAGPGFGISIVLRYLLEHAATTAEAAVILRRVPVHMSYSVALLDRAGHHATVYVNPDRPAEILARRSSTNHQHGVAWARHAEATRTVERTGVLDRLLTGDQEVPAVLAAFLRPPLYQTAYGRGYGTLYTAVYRPADASVELVWPKLRWRQSCADFRPGARTIRFDCGEPARPTVGNRQGGAPGEVL
jgi:predicted choloylglycine hydrolase